MQEEIASRSGASAPMQIGVTLAFSQHTTPEEIGDLASAAEERGFHSLWVPEHVVFFADYASSYPYSEDGRIPGEPDGVLDPFSALTFVAARTSRIRLGTGICIVPQRNPVYTARQVADLDYLSGGRFEFGIGVGWLAEEFAALGIPFDDRGPRTDECLAVMQALWAEGPAAHDGERFAFSGALLNPKPVQRPHPPIVVGGESAPAYRRAARIGQGWYGFNLDAQRLAGCLQRIDAALEAEGRSRESLRIYASPGRGHDVATLAAFREAGVQEAIVTTMGRDRDATIRRMDRLVEQVRELG